MPRHATPATGGALAAPVELSPSQLAALGALLAGSSVTAAAEQAAVSRETLHRWLREPAFAAAYKRQHRDLWEATETRLLRLAERATTIVERAIDQDGDVKAALAVLKGLGLLAGSAPVISAHCSGRPRAQPRAGSDGRRILATGAAQNSGITANRVGLHPEVARRAARPAARRCRRSSTVRSRTQARAARMVSPPRSARRCGRSIDIEVHAAERTAEEEVRLVLLFP
jgi:hypothetical protein